MGTSILTSCMNTDFFKDLLLKYGQMFIRLIVSEKMHILLQEKFHEVMAMIKQYVDEFVKRVNQIVDEKIKQLTEMFEEVKNNVEEMFPGRIREMEVRNGVGIDEITGFKEFLLKIDEVRDNALLKLQEIYKQVTTSITDKKSVLNKQIQQQRPHIPIYESLSDKTKTRVFKRAQNEFGQQIEEAQKKISAKCDSNFSEDVTKMGGAFDLVNPDSFLTQFVAKCAKEMLGKVVGGGCGGCGGC